MENKNENNIGWGFLGFFFPLVGLILFIVWKDTKKGASKASGIGALIGTIFSIIVTIISVVIVFTLIPTFSNTISTKTVPGNRIESKENSFDSNREYNITKEIIAEGNASKVSVRLTGKIVYILFTVSDKTTVQDAKNLGKKIITFFNEDELEEYDIDIIISKNNEEGTTKEFPLMGYKSRRSDGLTW